MQRHTYQLYSDDELKRVEFMKSMNPALPVEEYQQHTQVLKDLAISRLAHRNAIIDEACRRSMNVMEFYDEQDSYDWFEDRPVLWMVGDLKIRPSTIWTLYHVASVRGLEAADFLREVGIIFAIEDNFLVRWLNRRRIRNFEKIFAPLMSVREDEQLKAAWKDLGASCGN